MAPTPAKERAQKQRKILNDQAMIQQIISDLTSKEKNRVDAVEYLLVTYTKAFDTVNEFLTLLIKKEGLSTRIITVIRRYYTEADEVNS